MRFSISHITALYVIIILQTSCISLTGQVNGRVELDDRLALYADSLERLMLGHKTTATLRLADSLLQAHNTLDSPEIIRVKSAKANAYELLYNFEAALEIYNEILITLESGDFIDEEIWAFLSLARVYETVGKPELCKESLDRAFHLIQAHNISDKLSRYYVRSASYQRIYKDKSLALDYALKGVELGKQDGVARSVADGNILLGALTDDFDQAIEHFQIASQGFEELGDLIGAGFQDLNVVRKYVGRGEFGIASDLLREIEEYADTITDNERVYYQFQIFIWRIKELIYERLGKKDSVIIALRQHNKFSELFGSLTSQEEIDQLIFDNTLRQEKEKLEVAKRNTRILGGGVIGLVALLGFISAFYINNRRQKQKIEDQSKIIKTQYREVEKMYNYQSTLLSEVHHRIKNNLQLIISLLVLQKSKSNDTEDRSMFDTLNARVSSISLIHERLYNTKEFDKVDVGSYLEDLLRNFSSLISRNKTKIEYQVDNLELNLETITPLGLIWSELLSNSIKYNSQSKDLTISLRLVKEGDMYDMYYFDTGVGFPEGRLTANSEGMGATIIESLARQLAGEIKSFNDNGAHYYMRFKEKTVSPL